MGQATRQALLEKGLDILHIKGYHGAGIQDITDAVGVSKGSFYNHFKRKERFAAEVIDQFGRQLTQEHHSALSNTKLKPLRRIRKLYECKIKDVIHNQRFLKGCLLSNMCQEVADSSDLIARSVERGFDGMRGALTDCLDEAKRDRTLPANTDTELMAEGIVNSWNGALMRVKASRNAKALRAFMTTVKALGI